MMNQFGAGRLLKREQTCSLSLPAPSSGTEISEEYCQYSFESDLDLTMFFPWCIWSSAWSTGLLLPLTSVCSTSFHTGLIQVLQYFPERLGAGAQTMCCNFSWEAIWKHKGFFEGKVREEEKSCPHPGVAGRGSGFHLPVEFCLLPPPICTQQAALFN